MQVYLPEFSQASTPHMIAATGLLNHGMTVIASLPAMAACHCQDLRQLWVTFTTAIFMGDIPTLGADGRPTVGTFRRSRALLQVPRANPLSTFCLRAVPALGWGNGVLFTSRGIGISCFIQQGSGHLSCGDFLRAASNREATSVFQGYLGHLVDAFLTISVGAGGDDEPAWFDLLDTPCAFPGEVSHFGLSVTYWWAHSLLGTTFLKSKKSLCRSPFLPVSGGFVGG